MAQLPLFLNSAKLRCLLVGGGTVAARKLETLVKHGVNCTIVAKSVSDEVHELAANNDISIELRSFALFDLDGVNLVIAATNDREVNSHIAAACDSRAVMVNVVDDYELSTATFPAIVNRTPVIVAVSTDGRSPTLARRLKSTLEGQLSEGLGRVAEYISGKRRELGGQASRRLWDAVLDSTIPDLLERGDVAGAEHRFKNLQSENSEQRGFVSLVGAGPGDPALLTLKAVRCMERADVVYYDNLVATEVLERVRKDAKKVYVGKKRKFSGIRQAEINSLLQNDALAGKRVVRLKGGDPFMFGRGGEEIESLLSEGIDFEVVPGITAALGCAAYAGIPLTHRDYSQSVRFVTGHLKSDEIHLDWPELARPEQTLVVYMGLANLKLFTDNLIENGMATNVGIAVISRGTFPDQKVIKSTVGAIGEDLERHELVSPTTAIIGNVVAFADRDVNPPKD